MYYIGIDVGGTNLKAGLVNKEYNLLATKILPLRFETPERMAETLVETALALLEENGVPKSNVASVGLGFPGPVDNKKGMVIKTVNIPIRFLPLVEIFQARWEIPVYLGNDADCAALGEYYHLEKKDTGSMILVTLGTGIGTGIILGGKIVSGVNGFGGEGGHMVIAHGGELCTCGRRGCWERYASANALIRQTHAAMEVHKDSAMWSLAGGDLSRVDGKTAFEAMRIGDAAAKEVVETYLEYLAEGLSNLVNIFQPDVICLGGGVSHERDEYLLMPLRELVYDRIFSREAEVQTVITKARLGNSAGMIGAALLGANP